MINYKQLISEHVLDSEVSKFEMSLLSKYPQLDKLGMYIDSANHSLYLSDLYIKEEERGKGIGTSVIHDIIRFADMHRLPIVLLPDPDDADVTPQDLINYYKRFDFVVNKGRNTNFGLRIPNAVSMYKLPNKIL